MADRQLAARRRWYQSDWFVIPFMLTMLLAARSSLADHYHVPSGSMEFTIMTGDRVLVDKTAYGMRLPFTDIELVATGEPQRGDVAIFDSPADGRRLIKRIVAIAGDEVSLVDGVVYVNAAPETFAGHSAALNLSAGGGPDMLRQRIPDGFVLAIGDHRGNSIDSRYFGFVEAESLYGRALGIYYRRKEGLTWRAL